MKKTIFVTLLIIFILACTRNPQHFLILQDTKAELITELERYYEEWRRLIEATKRLDEKPLFPSPLDVALEEYDELAVKVSKEAMEMYISLIFKIFKKIKDDFEKKGYKPEDFEKTQYGAWLSKFEEFINREEDFSLFLKLKEAAERLQSRAF